MVNAVSENEVLGESTPLGLICDTDGSTSAVYYADVLNDYVFKASKKDLTEIAKIVLINASTGRSLSLSDTQWNSDIDFDYPAAHISTAFVYNYDIPNTTVHEFGHSFARLADEYVDRHFGTGAVKITLSKRSIIPPCPGISFE